MAELTCGKCGNTNPGDATFCGACGASLVAQRQSKAGERKPGQMDSDTQPGAQQRTTYQAPPPQGTQPPSGQQQQAPPQGFYQQQQTQYQTPPPGQYQQPDQQPGGYPPQYAPQYGPPVAEPVSTGEMFGWGCLTFFIPLVGLILSIIWLTKKRPNAVGCLVATIIYMVINFIGSIAFLVSDGGY